MAKIFVSFTIVSTANFFLVAREGAAEVYRSTVLVPPHSQRNVTIPDLNPVMHHVELWTTLDNVNLNQLRGKCDIDASQYTSLAFEPITFIAGLGRGAPHYDPAIDPNNEYINPDVAGKEVIYFKPGFGPLIWDVHIEKRLDIGGNDLGGFRFINGQVFGDGEEYTGLISNLQTQNVTSSGNGYPDGVVEVSANVDFSSTHYRKLIELVPAANITINIPDIDLIPENMLFGINTHNLSNDVFKYCTIQLPAGKYCIINGVQRNAVYIGRAESVSFIKKGAYLRILNWDGDYRRVGQRVYGDGRGLFNSLPMIGGWYSKDLYPRIFEWYVNNILPGELGTGTDDIIPDDVNQQKWCIGATKFWVPNYEGLFIRGTSSDDTVDLGGPRSANNYQGDDNKDHNHVSFPWNKAAAKASDISGEATPGSLDSNNPTTEYRVGQMTSDRWAAATIINQGTESRPKNVANNIYVII